MDQQVRRLLTTHHSFYYSSIIVIIARLGLIAGGGTGFIRIFKSGGPNFITDLIPVDYAIHLMIAVAWETAVNRYSS